MKTFLVVVGLVGMLSGSAAAANLAAGPTRSAGGYVRCTVALLADAPYSVQAVIVGKGRNVTEYLATEWQDEAGTMLKVLVAESLDQSAQFCRVRVSGTQRRDTVVGVFETFGADGVRTAVQELR